MTGEPYKGSTDWLGRQIKRPYPWERDVTVCIAAECTDRDRTHKIVLCTDRLGSNVLGGTETFLKNRSLIEGWRVLVAGAEPAINGLLHHYRLGFRDNYDGRIETLDAVMKGSAYARKRELANEYTQTHFAVSYDDFLRFGRDRFPDDIFRDAFHSIKGLELDAELIIVGFLNGAQEIYHCDRAGKVYPISGFTVIGEGAYLATAALMRRDQYMMCSLEKTLYNVYEAKRYAQAVGSVGKETVISVLDAQGVHRLISTSLLLRLREIFEEYGPKPLDNPEIAGPIYHDDEKRLALEAAQRSGNSETA
jgi:hypothetical protein